MIAMTVIVATTVMTITIVVTVITVMLDIIMMAVIIAARVRADTGVMKVIIVIGRRIVDFSHCRFL